ncbi:PREDICTED: serine carboxypeptidase-like 50 [Prunus mume]|uniref:Carboxypeptidase n=1 Tax=Prunus mume TaxID=102107 RepID=A0ABM0PRH4_PRUMU|nr:PREDICTED: serine carboxypeptidase-like 50 [Prunus mume]
MESTKLLLFFFFFFLHLITASSSSQPLFPKQAHPTKSGYLPVKPTTGSAIFYTFYEAQNLTISPDLSQTPLLIWLQGGPGCSSMIGNFFELGPWRVNFNKHPSEPLALEPNSGSWNRIFGLVFLDNPIGTGFSIAAKPEEIPRDQLSVARDLFVAITKFIELDPVFKSRPLYITGESYAGKYVPAIGYYILKRNAELAAGSQGVNLRGVAIGDGLTDPEIQVATHAVNAYFSGLINERQMSELEKLQVEAVGFTKAGNWSEATDARNRILNLLQNMTGLATLYDYTKTVPYKTSLVEDFLRHEEVKRALGVNGSLVFEECSDLVGEILNEDVMKSVKYMVEYLVKKSKVLLYQGQFDLRDGVVSTEGWVKTIKWEGIDKFLSAEREVWKVGGEVAGYVQKWGSLSHVLVSGAGHLLPADQPLRAQAMIEDWVLDKGLFGNAREVNLSSNFDM